MKRDLRALLLCDYRAINAATIIDHINALYEYSELEIHPFNPVWHQGELPAWVPLESFDVIVVHYSLYLLGDAYLSEKSKQKLAWYSGLKALFIQDEYRAVDLIAREVARCGIDLVFTCLDEAVAKQIYQRYEPKVKCVRVLTGYVPEKLKLLPPKEISERKIDVFYRGREYPPYHGKFGKEKAEIGALFRNHTRGRGLRYDIASSEHRRLYGIHYTEAIRSSRATLAVESGCSTFDDTGQLFTTCDMILQLMGKRRRKDAEEHCKQVYQNSLDLYPIAQISPRCFESIVLGTLLILYEGSYSGVLTPWKHYVPLKKDFSNIDDVVRVLKNDDACIKIIATAYAEIGCNPKYSFKKLAFIFDQAVFTCINTTHDKASNNQSALNEFFERQGPYYPANAHGMLIVGAKRQLIRNIPRTVLKIFARGIAKRLKHHS